MELHPSSKTDFKVKLWHQLVLSSALFTNEVAITYELIYMVTWEKLLGLPGQYVSLSGVISAVVSFILIPIMGRLGDRGNRLKRKCLLVILSGGFMVLGASCLLLGCILKLSVVSVFDSQMNCSMLWNNSVSVNREILPSNQSSVYKTEENCTHISDIDFSFKQEPISTVTSILAVLTFVPVDTGFDTGGSNIRSFMLECVEKSQHSKALSIGVIMSGGCAISALGLLDVNLNQSMDPNLVKAMMLSLFLIVSVVATVPATMICERYLLHSVNFDRQTQINTESITADSGDNPQDRELTDDKTANGLKHGGEIHVKWILFSYIGDLINENKIEIKNKISKHEQDTDSTGVSQATILYNPVTNNLTGEKSYSTFKSYSPSGE